MSKLNLPGKTHILANRDEVFEHLAQTLMQCATEAIEQRGVFHLALSGGSTPQPFYQMLVIDPRWRALPWADTHLWLVDERRVPETDEKSNFKMIRESLIDHVTLSPRQVHAMPVMQNDPAELYESQLAEAFGLSQISMDTVPRLDFMLLGMGDDAHTASIFPKSAGVEVHDRWVFVNAGEHVTPPDRVTLTYPVINAARHIAVLLCGKGKAQTLQAVSDQLISAGPDPTHMPITGVQPHADATLAWYLDQAATGQATD